MISTLSLPFSACRSWTLRYPTFYTKDFEEKKAKYLKEIETLVDKHDIPPQLIINWDHTGIHLVPVSRWIMAEKGSDKVEIIGLDDKRKITGEYFICVQILDLKYKVVLVVDCKEQPYVYQHWYCQLINPVV
jgi:hypothetical protein